MVLILLMRACWILSLADGVTAGLAGVLIGVPPGERGRLVDLSFDCPTLVISSRKLLSASVVVLGNEITHTILVYTA